MFFRRFAGRKPSSRRASGPNSQGPSRAQYLTRLRLEPLEDRSLLSVSIGGQAWNDLNGNGIQDAGEPGIAGAVVEIFSSTNATIGDTDDVSRGIAIADAGGNYVFSGLPNGLQYYEVFRAPVGFTTFTTLDTGGDDTRDSDVGSTGVTSLFTVVAGTTDTTRDAGLRGASPAFGFALNPGVSSPNGGSSIVTDAAGNTYVTGDFDQVTGDFDPGPGTYNLTGTGGENVFVAKYSPTGALVWARSMGGANEPSGDDFDAAYGYGIAVGDNGSVYVVGSFHGTADFDPGIGVCNLTSDGDYDIFIAKLDAAGAFVWANRIGAAGPDKATDVALASDGDICVTGGFNNTVDFNPGAPTCYLSGGTNSRFVAKFNPAGGLRWASRIGGTTAGYSAAIAVAADGNIYTMGSFRGTVDFDPDSDAGTLVSAGLDDIVVLKQNAMGDVLWARRFGGTGSDYAGDIAVDDNGDVFITGRFRDTVHFDTDADAFNLTSAGSDDVLVAKLTSGGSLLWASGVGGADSDAGLGIAVASDGSVYTTGTFRGTADFDPASGTFNLISAGEQDVFVLNLDVTIGSFAWACRTGGTKSDIARGVAAASDGGVYTTGIFGSLVDFNPRSGVFTLSGGTGQAFLSRLFPNHAPEDIAFSPNSTAENQPIGAALGSFSSVDPDAGEAFTYTLVSGAGSDDNAAFTINASGQLLTAAVFDYETKATYSIRVRTTDCSGMWCEKAFTLPITNINEPPTDIALSSADVVENEPSGTTVGDFSTSDPDADNTFTYALADGEGGSDNASFIIDGSTLKTAVPFDYEAKNSYSVRVRSTDQDGLSVEKTFVITVTDVSPALAFHLALVRDVSTFDDPTAGERDVLPASAEWIDEWDTCWIEVWLSTPDGDGVGISGAQLDLTYDTGCFTPVEIEHGPAFNILHAGTIDDASGVVDDLGAATLATDVGDDRYVLLARVRFESMEGDSGVPLGAAGRYVTAVSHGFGMGNAQGSLVVGGAADVALGDLPTTELWPVMYDIDNDGRIGLGDLSGFAAAYQRPMGDPFTWESDFDHDGAIGLRDLSYFAAAYRRQHTDAGQMTYHADFPTAWREPSEAAQMAARDAVFGEDYASTSERTSIQRDLAWSYAATVRQSDEAKWQARKTLAAQLAWATCINWM